MASKRPQERRRSGFGWIATMAGALLMVVVGFGIGFVSGAAFEEPGLFLEHLRGGMQPIALESAPGPGAPETAPAASALPPATPPRTEAAAPPAGPARSPAPPPPVAAAPPAAPAAERASARGSAYVIQVGAFGSPASARRLVHDLEASGFSGFVKEETSGPVRYKVRVGPFKSRSQAEAVAQRLGREKKLPTWVLSRDGE